MSFNMGNHLVTLTISIKYDQVWYCDSVRPSDSIIGEQFIRDWTDIMVVLNE
jgi:hypothetical protein